MQKKVILIVGPTGSGKTDLSIKMAQRFNGECINADATQIFNGLNLATNKITPSEQVGILHHLLSTIDLNENYSIKMYQQEGRKILAQLPDKTELHQYLSERVLRLTERGLFAEIEAAYKYCNYDSAKQSMKIIGCPEIIRYLKGELSYDATLATMVQTNKIYAKKTNNMI
ncbi:isopentenyl transferase family protein [Spiroplasma endosymbiont of Seladonia tumulorum]|uniref:isopentenyl transferase family protein n=1 Tax=Spiroplasma endosymbiont of Seladonia tumulorum TaxID=3066321 RepID=UPI0030CF6ADE